MSMTTSAAGVAAIRLREGCSLTAYRDVAGIPTIGVGHVNASPPLIEMGMTCTLAQADAWLAADLKIMELAVNEACGEPLSQNRFDASVSLAYNIGPGAFRTSSVARFCRARDWQAAADAFLMWDKASGREVVGLLKRRYAERAQFLAPDVPVQQHTATVSYQAPSIPSPGPVELPQGQQSGLAKVWAWLTGRAA